MAENRITRRTWLRRQRRVANEALKRYGIEFVRVDFVSASTNFIYRARTGDGGLYGLRVVAANWRTEENLRAEIAWLRALVRDTDIPLPEVVEARSGEPFVRLTDPYSGLERRALLVKWLPGISLAKRLNTINVGKLGELFATLHAHALGWTLPVDFPRASFTRFLGRGEDDLLFGSKETLVKNDSMVVLHATRERVERAYEAMPPNELQVIHCDLWHENVKIRRGVLSPIDFEDTILGYREHDIAMAWLDLAEAVPPEAYARYVDAFTTGYERVATFPSGDILSFQLGRILWTLNWIARFQPKHFRDAVEDKRTVLERALATDQLVLDSTTANAT